MKRFRDLSIRGEAQDLREFLDDLGRSGGGWGRAVSSEENINKDGGGRYVALTPPDGDDLKPATLFLYQGSAETEVTVANIVPRGSSLSEEEYNEIVRRFYDDLVAESLDHYRLSAEMTSDEVSAADVLSADNVTRLKRFSLMANKSTGSSHPNDQDRWFSFIGATFSDDEVLEGSLLRGLLVEQGWSDERAAQLASEYEFGVALLRAYTS